jgi:hypothetical protein
MKSERRRTPRYPRIPPTHPLGKLDTLDITFSLYRGTVRIDFGKKIEWFAVPAEQARAVADLLIDYADRLDELETQGCLTGHSDD